MADISAEEISGLAAPFVGSTGGTISALRAIQAAHGHIPDASEPVLADLFNLSRAEVRGVISFYADFSRQPKGETVVRLCAAEACQAAGGRELEAEVKARLGLKVGETHASGAVSLEHVYCLGLCSVAPAAMVGDQLVGRADADRVEAVVAAKKTPVVA